METIVFATLLLVFTILSLLSPSRSDVLGFSTDLVHMDSPPSPFYNPLLTHFEHLSNGIRRSHKRVNHFLSLCTKKASGEIIPNPNDGSYLMKIALGTPKYTVYATADTGSDLTWTQCAPCKECYKQKAHLFDPKKSSTYKLRPCNSGSCVSLLNHQCTLNGTCEYAIEYGDRSYSKGSLASETLTLGSVSFPNITFGCGFHNVVKFNEKGSGIIGLGGGVNSIISQIKSSIRGKFSYCLAPFSTIKNKSKINFGKNAVVSGTGVVSTPLVAKYPDVFYFLTLEALSVGKQRINFFNSSSDSNIESGNTFIDSGSTFTYVPDPAYTQFESLVKKAIGGKTVPDPLGYLKLCYRLSDNPSIPTISAHFTGATIHLNPINTFVQTSDDVTCFAFATFGKIVPGQVTIFGNIAQTNFLVGYDLVKRTVSFRPEKCGDKTH